MESIPFPPSEFKRHSTLASVQMLTQIRYYTSLGGTFRVFEEAIKISGAGFSFSNASADTMASNLKNNEVQGRAVNNRYETPCQNSAFLDGNVHCFHTETPILPFDRI